MLMFSVTPRWAPFVRNIEEGDWPKLKEKWPKWMGQIRQHLNRVPHVSNINGTYHIWFPHNIIVMSVIRGNVEIMYLNQDFEFQPSPLFKHELPELVILVVLH